MNNQALNRAIVWASVALFDAVLFCVLIGNGQSLRSSHMASFAAAMTLNYILKISASAWSGAHIRGLGWHCRLLVLALLALFLRGGVLALLTFDWGWAPQLSIVFAVIAGSAVMTAGYSPLPGAADFRDRARVLTVGVIAYAVALRLVYMGSVELLPEETYYWNYSRHLDIGYLDHPPMVAWLIRLGTAVFGSSQFGVRVGALCCAAVTSVFTYRLTRNVFGEASALAALLLAQVLPFFFLSGLLMTPDAPLTAAWAAALYYLERALLAGRSEAWWRVGFSLGVGALSKYSIGLLVPVTAIFMLWDPQSRPWWRQREPYLAALIALAVFSPVMLWNAQHEWASFAFQTSRRLAEAPRFALHKLIAGALVLITPTGVLAIAVGLRGPKPGSAGDGARLSRFFALAVLVPMAVFALFSLRHEVKLDWTGAPWVAALPVMAAGMIAEGAGLNGIRAFIRAAWAPTVAVVLLIYGAGLHYLALGLPGVGYGTHTELVPVGWRDFSRQIGAIVAQVQRASGESPLIVGMDRYVIASELAFYGTERTHSVVETSSAHLFDSMGLMYERWTPPASVEGRTLLLVAWSANELTGEQVQSHVDRLGPIEDGVLRQDGQVVRHYYYRLAYNYRSEPIVPWRKR